MLLPAMLALAAGADVAQTTPALSFDGYLRLRGDARHNFDLDHGITPSGDPLYPVPLADSRQQNLYAADMRLRLDVRGESRIAGTAGVALVLRADVLDNAVLGATPAGDVPAASTSQRGATDAVTIKRVYGEATTPFGILSAGRMGHHWGLGMLANSGDCDACDRGDAVDRIAFLTPLAGHVWALAFDFSATGPVARAGDRRSVDLEPTDDVRTAIFAVGDFEDRDFLQQLRENGESVLEYGVYVSHRWQENDVPADYLAGASGQTESGAAVMARGYRATALDVWTRISLPRGRIELEAALLVARVEEPSLVPGVLYETPVTSRQIGAALESELELVPGISAGLDAGYVSGDRAPGFGARATASRYPQAGDLDGPQAQPPHDLTVDNFRFHADYRVDRILFREIIGTVTDAIYVRPHVGWAVVDGPVVRLRAELAAVAARAAFAASTPTGEAPLGIELDPTLVYEAADGFRAALEYAYLWPLSGLDNPHTGQPARAAQRLELRLTFEI